MYVVHIDNNYTFFFYTSGLYRGIFFKYTWFRWTKTFWMCLGISSSFFRVSHPKSTPSVLKKYLNDVFETYRSHDMVMHLCIFQFFFKFRGPDWVWNDFKSGLKWFKLAEIRLRDKDKDGTSWQHRAWRWWEVEGARTMRGSGRKKSQNFYYFFWLSRSETCRKFFLAGIKKKYLQGYLNHVQIFFDF